MLDPVIQAHRLGPRLFSIGGKLFPISIRDQMVRGEMFIERAWDSGLIGPEDQHPLYIVGAGASGVTAAMRASERGVRTVLVERNELPFDVQAGCPSRWISPTIYDFPAEHWDVGKYPACVCQVAPPLPWAANWADELAVEWRTLLNDFLVNKSPPLSYRPYSKLISVPGLAANKSSVEVELRTFDPIRNRSYAKKETAAVVLIASGFGTERRYLQENNQPPQASWGFKFWEEDPFAKPDFGLPGTKASVLISGSGDGALQDFLRVTTRCKSPDELYRAVNPDMKHVLHLMQAQEWAHRSFIWGNGSRRHDHGELAVLHQVHQAVVDDLLQSNSSLQSDIHRLLRDPLPDVRMVYECSHFTQCYGLNRFLVLLVGKYLEKFTNAGQVFYGGRKVKSLKGRAPHVCKSDASDCHGKDHEVSLVECSDCTGNEGAIADQFEANVLVLRHGLDMTGLPEKLSPPHFRQSTPYQVPR